MESGINFRDKPIEEVMIIVKEAIRCGWNEDYIDVIKHKVERMEINKIRKQNSSKPKYYQKLALEIDKDQRLSRTANLPSEAKRSEL